MAKSRSIRLDDETETMLQELDSHLNLESNVSAVFRLAIRTLYQEKLNKNIEKEK